MKMMRFSLAVSLLAMVLTMRLDAQSADSEATADTVFLRVQRLAANGQGDAARALVQQEFEVAPTASPRFVEALYWRAVVAATAADAERDLRTIIVDYPLSPWTVEALMRLAQLEMTRREMDQALAHLNRVVVEHPSSNARPRASFWIARVMFEQGKLADACRELADASRTAPASQVELRNQIDYWSSRCSAADSTGVAAGAVAGRPADSGKTATATTRTTTTTPPPGTPKAAPARTPAPPPAAPAAKRQYTVQVAAYNTRSAAEVLAQSLRDRNYDARVFGTIAPYRVRIGRYDTRADAERASEKLNAKKITCFVTEAEAQ